MKRFFLANLTLFIMLATAFIIRVLVAFPSFKHANTALIRPDSNSYIQGAKSLLLNGSYTAIDGSLLSFYPPGYSFYLSIIYYFSGFDSLTPYLLGIVNSIIIILIGYLIALEFTTKKNALLVVIFLSLNITHIAIAPLILSDMLFTIFAGISILMMIRFFNKRQGRLFLLSLFFASFSCYIRPTMIFWWMPALFLLWFFTHYSIKKKFLYSILGGVLFLCVMSPWMIRNYINDIGYNISSSAGSLYRYNSVVTMKAIQTGENSESIRTRYLIEDEKEYLTYSDSYRTLEKRNSYLLKKSMEEIKAHPIHFFFLHMRPSILLPDVATFCENLGLTTHNRGTFDILNREGYYAAIKYYFEGKMYLFYILIPLVLLSGLFYLATLYRIILTIKRKEFFLFFFFMASSYYFLFVSGPVTMPRYQIPALFLIGVYGAMGISEFWEKVKSIYLRKKKN